MLRIVTHIERLLLMHDCVIIPRFGGFVSQQIPVTYQEEDGFFIPAHKVISFNATLQHNDGLLNESYMQQYGVNYRKAALMLEEDVAALLQQLNQYKKVNIGSLGRLLTGSEGQWEFVAASAQNLQMESFGLPTFHFAPLATIQSNEAILPTKAKDRDMVYIPVKRIWLKVAASVAAAVGLFLLISTPVKEVNPSVYKASFIPSATLISESVLGKPVVSAVQAESKPEKKEVATMPTAVNEVVEKEIINTIAERSASVAKSNKMFHIVIASFPTESQADAYIQTVDKNICRNVKKILRDKKYRVYADKFDNREAAESYMTTIRNHSQFKDAWLLICK